MAQQRTSITINRLDGTTGAVVARTDEHNFQMENAGYSAVRHFVVAGQAFVLLLRRNPGLPREIGHQIHHLNSDGTLGQLMNPPHPQTPAVDLGSAWSDAKFLALGDETYLALHHAYARRITIYQALPGGRLLFKSASEANDFKDKSLFSPYALQGKHYFLGLNTWTGEATFYAVDGQKIGDQTFTLGWTSLDHLTVNGNTYRLLYKVAGHPFIGEDEAGDEAGRLVISRVLAEGLDSEPIYDNILRAGWSTVRFLQLRNSQAILLYNRKTGDYRVRQFDESAGVETVLHSGNIGAGWTDLEPYTMGFQTYLIALNEENVEPFYFDEVEIMAREVHEELKDSVVGYQFALMQSGKIIYSRAWGQRRREPSTLPMTARTRMNLGSVGKMFTATTVLKLADTKQSDSDDPIIDLDRPIATYLPAQKYPPAALDDWVSKQTVLDLLKHTSGMIARSGIVTAGSAHHLTSEKKPQGFDLPSDKKAADIVGVAIRGSDNQVFAWYAVEMDDPASGETRWELSVSAGKSWDLSMAQPPEPVRLPAGKSPTDIRDIAMRGGNDHVYTWYADRTVSIGTPTNLGQHQAPTPYVLPGGKTPAGIRGIGIHKGTNEVYAWYNDGTFSIGKSWNLGEVQAPRPYAGLPLSATQADVKIKGMDFSNFNHVFTWYDYLVECNRTSPDSFETTCIDFFSVPQNVDCDGSDCPRHYNNANFGALRTIIEGHSQTKTTTELIEFTHDLWMKRIDLENVTCRCSEDVHYFDSQGIGRLKEACLSHSCGAGGWHASSLDMLQYMAAVRYRKVLSAEMTTRFLNTSLTAKNGPTAVAWEKPSTFCGDKHLYKGGSVAGFDALIFRLPHNTDAVLLVNTNTPRMSGIVKNAYMTAKGCIG